MFPLSRVQTRSLRVGYVDIGPRDAEVVMLLHGFPYSIRSYDAVIDLLHDEPVRIVMPHLRGHGETSAVDDAGRSGQQAALGSDVIELMDALNIDRAVLAGYDWGGRAACVAAAAWPERCRGVVSVNGYLIQDIAAAGRPLPPALEAGFWYFFYFATERGRAGLEANPREVARTIWIRNSPLWNFSESDLDRAAEAFANPDYVEVVIHSYRHRLGLAAGHPRYGELEARLAGLPPIVCPAVTLDGEADGNFPATDGTAHSRHFTGAFSHHTVERAGHNLPQEAPRAFADAVLEVLTLGEGQG